MTSTTWKVWPWTIIRMAGFPSKLVDEIRSDDAIALLDRVIAATRARDTAADDLLAGLAEIVPTDKATQRYVAKRVRVGGPLDPARRATLSPAALEKISMWERACDALATSDAEARSGVAKALEAARTRLRGVACDHRFLEAVYMSSPEAHERLSALAETAGKSRNESVRRPEITAAQYLQRVAAKYDTVSFFGPQVWARIGDAAEPVSIDQPTDGSEIRTRYVTFANWAVDALAERVRQDPATFYLRRLGKSPLVRVEGDVLHFGGKKIDLPYEYVALLRHCDGSLRAGEIAERAIGEQAYADFESAFSDLAELVEQGIVVDLFRVGTRTPHPQWQLRDLVAEMPEELAAVHLPPVEDLVQAAHAMVTAEEGARIPILRSLEEKFTAATGVAARRRGGETYASRQISWEDCERASDVTFGSPLRQALESAGLQALLRAARWATHESARRRCEGWKPIVAAMGGQVELVQFFNRVAEPDAAFPTLENEVLAEMRTRAATALLATASDVRSLDLTEDQITTTMGRAFPDVPALTTQARFHTVEFQLDSPSMDALAAGDFQIVITDLLAGGNAVTNQMFLQFCPWRDELLDAYARVTSESGAAITIADPPDRANRATNYAPPADGVLELFRVAGIPRVAHSRPLADYYVTEQEGELVLASWDGSERHGLARLFAETFTWGSLTRQPFSLLEGPHVPRVTVGRVVIQREQWTFPTSAVPLEGLAEHDERALWGAVRRWQKENRIPDEVLVVIPEEMLPFYLDFRSLFLVETFVRWVRRSTQITLTECLPSTTRAWLPSAHGPVTCAIRVAYEGNR